MAFSFGIASELNAEITLVSFLGTIFFLMVFDFFTGLLEYSVQESPIYTKVVHKIYKELMAMGFVSFTLAMYQASKPPPAAQSWITVLDFVGYVIFFVAIFFVAHALYIMMVSIYSSKEYARFHVMTISELLEQTSAANDNWFWKTLYVARALPVSYVRTKAEFKIIYVLFRDTYWLPNDFNYGSYVAQCLARYSLRMVNISTWSWAGMALLCCVNYARLKVGGKWLWNCESALDVERFNGSCQKVHTELFLVCAAVVVLYIAVLYFVGRVYVLRLLSRAGVTDIEDYETFLIMEENTLLKVDRKRNVEIQVPEATAGGRKGKRRMSITTFRKNIEVLRTEMPTRNDEHKLYRQLSSMAEPIVTFKHQVEDGEVWRSISNTGSRLLDKIIGRDRSHDSARTEGGLIFRGDSFDAAEGGTVADDNHFPVPVPRLRPSDPSSRRQQRRSSLTLTLCGGPGLSQLADDSAHHTVEGGDKGSDKPGSFHRGIGTAKSSPPQSSKHGSAGLLSTGRGLLKAEQSLTTIEKFMAHKLNDDKNTRRNSYDTAGGAMKLQEDFSDIYFFSSPQIYFKTVEIGIMLNSLYLAMWVCNFITVVDMEFSNNWLWQCVMLLPLVFVMPFIGPIVKVASMLSAIAELDLDVIGAVLEESEDIKNLISELRNKVEARIKGRLADKRNVILALFYEIDSDASGSIDKLEFRDMLRALHLHYSDQKFERLYRAVDRDKNGSLSLQELEHILLPEDAEAREQVKRANVVRKQLELYKNKQHSFKEEEHGKNPILLSRFSWLSRSSLLDQETDKSSSGAKDESNPPGRLSKMKSESRMSLVGLPFQPLLRGIGRAKTSPRSNSDAGSIEEGSSSGRVPPSTPVDGDRSSDGSGDDTTGIDNNIGQRQDPHLRHQQLGPFPGRLTSRSRLPSVVEHHAENDQDGGRDLHTSVTSSSGLAGFRSGPSSIASSLSELDVDAEDEEKSERCAPAENGRVVSSPYELVSGRASETATPPFGEIIDTGGQESADGENDDLSLASDVESIAMLQEEGRRSPDRDNATSAGVTNPSAPSGSADISLRSQHLDAQRFERLDTVDVREFGEDADDHSAGSGVASALSGDGSLHRQVWAGQTHQDNARQYKHYPTDVRAFLNEC